MEINFYDVLPKLLLIPPTAVRERFPLTDAKEEGMVTIRDTGREEVIKAQLCEALAPYLHHRGAKKPSPYTDQRIGKSYIKLIDLYTYMPVALAGLTPPFVIDRASWDAFLATTIADGIADAVERSDLALDMYEKTVALATKTMQDKKRAADADRAAWEALGEQLLTHPRR